MSSPIHLKQARSAACALAVVFAFAAVPAGAQAAPVDLATARPFVVLGGQSVTNAGGPSVLYGELGVSPGTSLFGSPSTVYGATHNNDAVAAQAQSDLTTAYNVAAAATPFTVLTGQDLGGKLLFPGVYKYASSAQLTGTLTLDAQNDPNAQFIFQVGSQLTTASASVVSLINGANPCNVYWQIGSSAVLGSTTTFQGNILALTSISLNDAATVTGRALARNGSVTLIHNVLDGSRCGIGTSSPDAPGGTPPGTTPAPGGTGTAIMKPRPRKNCRAGFRARVRGHLIKRVRFSVDGKAVSSRTKSPFQVYVAAAPGRHTVRARVTFKDTTKAKNLKLRYRACAAAVLRPARGPSRFTG